MTGSINRQSAATKDVEKPFSLGGLKLNLLEFIWLVNCAIVTDHYSFQCSTAMPFLLVLCGRVRTAYHKTSRGKGAVMETWLSNIFNGLEIIMHPL